MTTGQTSTRPEQVYAPLGAHPSHPTAVSPSVVPPVDPQQHVMHHMAAPNPVQGEVYTMADLHSLAIMQGRRLRFRRRQEAHQSPPEHQ